MNPSQTASLIAQTESFVDKVLNLEKGHSFPIGGRRLYPSEIHLLLAIAAQPRLNATGLAERLGQTKGAVSQKLARLEQKEMIVKTRDTSRKNELILEFTPLGRQVVDRFRKVQAAIRAQHDAFFASLDETEQEVIRRFLTHLDRVHGRHG